MLSFSDEVMNSERIPTLIAISILLASAVIVYDRNATITSLENENHRLMDDITTKTEDVNTLQAEVNGLTSSIESMITSIEMLETSISQIEEEVEITSYARVVSTNTPKVYVFEETLDYFYNVEYSFQDPTDVVFTVLDTDRRTVLGFMDVTLEGEGTEKLLVEIKSCGVPGKWTVYPSVYWLEDGTPTYSTDGWTMTGAINVIDGSPGHTQDSCSEESAICHSG